MSVTDLESPRLRPKKKQIREYIYNTGQQIFLPTPSKIPRASFFSTIMSRETRRQFGHLSTIQLANILWFTCKTLRARKGRTGIWQHRCTPSAGGIHPIDIMIFAPGKSSTEVFIYDPVSHSLNTALNVARPPLKRLLSQIKELNPLGLGTVVWFVGQFEKTLGTYKNGESLVWRDSGALTASFCFVAEALNLNCCALGITGDSHIAEMFGGTPKLKGVGGCLLGSRSQ